ncbi:hypothetical protein IPH19_00705 [Candidatus Uhrbacteria bacterium]|nr:MAG: hypothetical protein IPH19_00705 [Candidatus Uhrbacteria bacterium]
MNERLQRVLLIVGFFLVVIGIAFGIYWVFFRPPGAVVTPPTGTIQPGGTLPSAGTGGPQVATTTPTGPGGLPVQPGTPFVPSIPTGIPTAPRTQVLRSTPTRSVSVSQNGQIRGYNPEDGRFYRISTSGESVPMSNQTFFNVDTVAWGNSSDKAIINYPDGSNILYDFSNDRQVTLPKHWEDFQFSPDDDRIVAKSVGNNEDNRFLVVSNPDGTNARPIESLGENQNKVHSSWSPNNQIVAYSFTGEPLGLDRQQIILLGQNQENFKGLVVEGRGFIPNWAPSGQNLLYSVHTSANNYLPTLWVSGAAGDSINANRINLQINTWADKCTWQGEQTLICGVPTRLGQGAGLQREIFQNNPDEIWKINLATGEKINLGQPQGGAAVQNMSVTPDGRSAIFTDQISGRLIRFDL